MLARWFFIAVVGVALMAYVRAPESDAAAGTVTQSCSTAVPGTTTMTVAWPKPGSGATQTWFDISLVPGFAWGWFQGHGPLSVNQTAYAFDGVPKNLNFYYRVNTLYSDGIWRETASGSFVSGCGGSGGGGAPVAQDVSQVCDGAGNVSVTFKWAPNAPGQQWLDLSTYNNGFAPGTFVGAGPVGSGAGSYTWHGIGKGWTHYWRVNTLTPSGWVSSNTASFTASTCQPPLKSCIAYLAGYAGGNRADCETVMNGSNATLADCIGYIMGVRPSGAGACGRLGSNVDPLVVDCLLGLSGGSHFGKTSCRIYTGN